MHRLIIFCQRFLILIAFCNISFAQVGINTNDPHESSALEIFSDNGGILIPRISLMSTSDVMTVPSPTESLLIYNTATISDVSPGFYYWDGAWIPFRTGGTSLDWRLNGNSVTALHFLGTTNSESLKIRVGNTQRWEFTNNDQIVFSNNQIKIGNTTTLASGDGALAIGLDANANADFTTALGRDATVTSLGIGGTALGYNSIVSGENSLAIGRNSSATAFGTTALGYESTASGIDGIAVGRNAAADGEKSIAIGPNADNGGFDQSIALGFAAVNTKANQLRYGNVTEIDQVSAMVVNASDGRFKYDIQENVPGLKFVNKLRPVTYKFDIEKLHKFHNEKSDLKNTEQIRSGFIAQEVESATNKISYSFDGLVVPENPALDNYKVSYQQFVVPLVQSVQELHAQVKELESQNIELRALLEEYEALKKALLSQSIDK